MAKESGLGWTTCSIDDSGTTLRAIINDVVSIDFSTPRGVQEVSGIDKSAMERLLLLADFQSTINGIFNDAATTGAHTVLKDAGSTSVARTETLVISGQTLTNEVFLTDFQMSRAPTGEFTFVCPTLLQDGTAPTWS